MHLCFLHWSETVFEESDLPAYQGHLERSFYLCKLEVCFQLTCGTNSVSNWYRTTENYIWLTLSLLTFDHNSISTIKNESEHDIAFKIFLDILHHDLFENNKALTMFSLLDKFCSLLPEGLSSKYSTAKLQTRLQNHYGDTIVIEVSALLFSKRSWCKMSKNILNAISCSDSFLIVE
jgi:hypothetical protein